MSTLNEDQKRAASHARGHAVVLAGPGTGKTKTLIARHSYLRSRNISPRNIFVVTFTKPAAEEIKRRLGDGAGGDAWIGTFHSLALKLLRRFTEEAGLPKNFKVLDPGAQNRVLREMGVDWNQEDGDLLDMFSRWKDSMTTPEQAMADAQQKSNITGRLAAEHYQAYENHLRQKGLLDFSDLLGRCLTIIKSSDKVKAFVGQTLPYALVDEFQDVNKVQVELLQAMAEAGTKVWAVGDDDQALYGWRGSNVFYTVQFSNYFANAQQYTLRTNYRCDPAIIRAGTALIVNNKHRVRKELVASRPHSRGTGVRVSIYRDEREEAERIADSIQNFVAKGAKPSDVGILVRTSSMTAHIQQALELKRISMSLTGALNFWETPEVKAVVDLLDAIEKGDERPAYRYKGGADLVRTLNGLPPAKTAESVGKFISAQPPNNSSNERVAAWSDAVEAISAMAAEHPSAAAFRQHVDTMSAHASVQSSDGVSLRTVHSSKGLEYRHVFIAGVEAAMMPHKKSVDIEEERRLFYVALTRSKGSVDISLVKHRAGRKQTPSPFLMEINAAGPECVRWMTQDKAEEARQAEPAVPQKSAPTTARVAEKVKGMPTIYFRKDGSRTMVPPEE
jgi:DNA helicase-2/ATP-dependent DNA helicase PcrA